MSPVTGTAPGNSTLISIFRAPNWLMLIFFKRLNPDIHFSRKQLMEDFGGNWFVIQGREF